MSELAAARQQITEALRHGVTGVLVDVRIEQILDRLQRALADTLETQAAAASINRDDLGRAIASDLGKSGLLPEGVMTFNLHTELAAAAMPTIERRLNSLHAVAERRDRRIRAALDIHHDDGEGMCHGCGLANDGERLYSLADCPTRAALTGTG